MFRVKICGIRTLKDLAAATAAGADAIGLNFYGQSKRCVGLGEAKAISAAASGKLLRVGLFVDLRFDGLEEICNDQALDAIQAHGNEDTAWFRDARKLNLPLIRAIRCPESAAALRAEIDRVPPDQDFYDALLIDGSASGSTPSGAVYGGAGALANWQLIREIRDTIQLPLVLAGGLTPGNVAEAIRSVTPDGVDVASGVEDDYGGKDADKVASFTMAARIALENTAS